MTSTKYIGLDVHKESISIAVLNSAGKVVMECVIETKASTILQFIHRLGGNVHLTFEEGTWAGWLYDLLKPHVTELVVCNRRKNALLRKGFGGYAFAGAFAFPFVVFAEQGFMFLYLRFDFVESFFAAGTEVFAGCSGVECSRRESEIQGQCVFLFARQL